MKKQEAIDHFGSASKLARSLFITRQAVFNWGEYPPIGRQYQIESITSRQLKATEKVEGEND